MTTGFLRARETTPESRGLQIFVTDLGIGAGMSLRGGRLRLLLTAAGIAMCVLVLLLGLSMSSAISARTSRIDDLAPTRSQNPPPAGTTGFFQATQSGLPYDGKLVTANYLAPLRGSPPPPPGVLAFPAPGDLFVSPALSDLLASPAGAGLRRQIPGRIAGTIEPTGLASPHDLRFYKGIAPTMSSDVTDASPSAGPVFSEWGHHGLSDGGTAAIAGGTSYETYYQPLTDAGVAISVVPLVIFVLVMSRLGEAARTKRSVVIRLLGASGRQARTVLAGEIAVAVVLGIGMGTAGFFLARLAAPLVGSGLGGFFPSDVSPGPAGFVLVLTGVPAVALTAAVFGSRASIRDPLEAGSMGLHRRMRSFWRVALVLTTAAVIGGQIIGLPFFVYGSPTFFAASVVMVLIVIPVLLPLLLRALLAALKRKGSPAVELAVRRLGVDPHLASRMIAGPAVVLAGAIALQSLVAISMQPPRLSSVGGHSGSFLVQIASPTLAEVTGIERRIASSGGYTDFRGGSYLTLSTPSDTSSVEVYVGSCGQIEQSFGIDECRDGDAFAMPGASAVMLQPGTRWESTTNTANGTSGVSFTVPSSVRTVAPDPVKESATDFAPNLVLTVGALGPQPDALLGAGFLYLLVRPPHPDAATLQSLRTTLGDLAGRGGVQSFDEVSVGSGRAQLASVVQIGLLLVGALTILAAVAGLVLVSLDQVRERRRSLTLLVAAGTRRTVIGGSIVTYALLPAACAAVLAVAVGLGLSVFMQLVLVGRATVDGWSTPVYAGLMLLAVAGVSVATLPMVRRMTRPESLRTG